MIWLAPPVYIKAPSVGHCGGGASSVLTSGQFEYFSIMLCLSAAAGARPQTVIGKLWDNLADEIFSIKHIQTTNSTF